MYNKKQAIGIFDSGLGGLTVLKEIEKVLPNEDIIYFGDTARVPYGPRSSETVTKYTFQSINFLLENNIKAIVIACNTSSARSLTNAQNRYNIPIIGVVKPGAKAAFLATKNKKIGIIGTQGTISSKAYDKEISILDKNIEVFSNACSLFVPLVEEGWAGTDIAEMIARKYLDYFTDKDIDTLVLGCTHYPILIDTIKKIVKDKIMLINPAVETAIELQKMLEKNNLLNDKRECENKYFVSDLPESFQKIGEEFLNKKFDNITKIEIQKF